MLVQTGCATCFAPHLHQGHTPAPALALINQYLLHAEVWDWVSQTLLAQHDQGLVIMRTELAAGAALLLWLGAF